MGLAQALSIVGVLVVILMGLAIVIMASLSLAVMLRAGQLPARWAIVVTAYEVGLGILVSGIEIDLAMGAGLIRGVIYGVGFTILLTGLAVQARIIGNQADKDRRAAVVLRQRMNLLKIDKGKRET